MWRGLIIAFALVGGAAAETCNAKTLKGGRSFGGANSFHLHTVSPADRDAVLDAMAAAGMKNLRIFLGAWEPAMKGASNPAVPDIESPVGVWDDAQLDMADGLLLAASQRGIKLTVALHNRYSLGCWRKDAHAVKYSIPEAPHLKCNPARSNDATGWYKSRAARDDLLARFLHVINHKNPLMGGRAWKDIPEAILSFDIQNESQGHGDIADASWVCDMATRLKPHLSDNGVLISTGGGIAVDDSILPEHFACPTLDVVAVHSYNPDVWAGRLPCIVETARAAGKRIIVQEFGAAGAAKAASLEAQLAEIQRLGVPWNAWQVTKPGNPADLETWTDEGAAWAVLADRSKEALAATSAAFDWPEVFEEQRATVTQQPATESGEPAGDAPVAEVAPGAAELAAIEAALGAAVPALLSAAADEAGAAGDAVAGPAAAPEAAAPAELEAAPLSTEERATVQAAFDSVAGQLLALGAGGPAPSRRLKKVDRM